MVQEMKNNKLTLTLITIFLFVIFSCQDINSPSYEIEEVNITLKIIDNTGNPVSGVSVSYNKGKNNRSDLSPFGYGVTNSSIDNGILSQAFSIPTSGAYYTVELKLPKGLKVADSSILFYPEIMFPCKDTLLIFTLPLVLETVCYNPVDDIILSDFIICPDEVNKDSIRCSNIININCKDTVEISVDELVGIPNARSYIKTTTGRVSTSSVMSIYPGEGFQICIDLSGTKSIFTPSTQILNISVKPKNGNEYILTTIKFNVQYLCSECECPSTDFVINYPDKEDKSTYCIYTQDTIRIDLSKVINPSKDCTLKFSQVKGLDPNMLEVVSFNDNVFALGPKAKLSKLIVQIRGTKTGTFSDEIVYSISLVDSKTGVIKNCNQKLKINISYTIESPVCEFDRSKMKSNDINLYYGIGIPSPQPYYRDIPIMNSSTSCPLVITGANLKMISPNNQSNNPFEIITRLPIVIPPLSTANVRIEFKPDDRNVFHPDGNRKNPKILDFTSELEFNTNCRLDKINVEGKVLEGVLPTKSLTASEYGPAPKNYQGLFFSTDGSVTTKSYNNESYDFALYTQSVDLVNKTARLCRGFDNDTAVYIRFSKVSSGISFPNNICDIGTTNSYGCSIAAISNDNCLNVTRGDLIAIYYSYYILNGGLRVNVQYCAFMLITAVRPDSADPSVGVVDFEICTGF